MRHKVWSSGLASVLVAACLAVARAQVPNTLGFTIVAEQGAPVKITTVAGYDRKTESYGVVMSSEHIYCISFVASPVTVTSVTFEMYHQRLDKSVRDRVTIERNGTFSPGIEIKGYQGEAVRGGGDGHALANCIAFPTTQFTDAPVSVVRPIRATLADGSTWTSALPVAVVATPTPLIDDGPAPVWDATHRADYVAIVDVGTKSGKSQVQTVRIYAPHHHLPSAVLTLPCCAYAAGFDARGDLFLTTREKVLVFAPGSTTPAIKLSGYVPGQFAMTRAGDFAMGAPTAVNVYPASGAPYSIAGGSTALAIGPDGEVAIADPATGSVQIYARGSAVVAQTITGAIAMPAAGTTMAARLVYGPDGRLAIQDRRASVTHVYLRASVTPAYTLNTSAYLTFDDTGRAFIVGQIASGVFSPVGKRDRQILRGGTDISAGAGGRFAILDNARLELAIYESDGSETIIPMTLSQLIAISP